MLMETSEVWGGGRGEGRVRGGGGGGGGGGEGGGVGEGRGEGGVGEKGEGWAGHGEPLEEVLGRMTAAIEEMIERHPGKGVVAVTHGMGIMSYLTDVLHLEP